MNSRFSILNYVPKVAKKWEKNNTVILGSMFYNAVMQWFLSKKILSFFLILLIGIGFFYSSLVFIKGEINFNTDIARDFLLMQEIVTTHKPSLIGPRSGAMTGLFHGPLWMYINLPAFIIGDGNPLVVGWFWEILTILSIICTFYVGKKLFTPLVGLLAAAFFSFYMIPLPSYFLNPAGSLILSPLFFYFYYTYVTKKQYISLVITLFLIGLLIQFQIAFGGPMLLLVSVHVLLLISKKKRWKDMSAFFVLLIPLSTYLLFDIRHDFLQMRAVIANIMAIGGSSSIRFTDMLMNRFTALSSGIILIQTNNQLLHLFLLFLFVGFLFQAWKTKYKTIYMLFIYLFTGYALFSFFLKGNLQIYHMYAFIPLTTIILASFSLVVNRYIFTIFSLFLLLQLFLSGQQFVASIDQKIKTDAGSWQFNKQVAEKVFADGEKAFGYYIYSADEYGYSPRYTMSFVAKQYPRISATAYEKKPITYLLISPYNADPSRGAWWKKNKVHITKKPEKVIRFANGYTIEKYFLTPEEATVSAESDLIKDLIFR